MKFKDEFGFENNDDNILRPRSGNRSQPICMTHSIRPHLLQQTSSKRSPMRGWKLNSQDECWMAISHRPTFLTKILDLQTRGAQHRRPNKLNSIYIILCRLPFLWKWGGATSGSCCWTKAMTGQKKMQASKAANVNLDTEFVWGRLHSSRSSL